MRSRTTLRPAVATALALTAVWLLDGCGRPEPESAGGERVPEAQLRASASALDFPSIAAVLVDRMGLRPGERVLLVGAPDRFSSLVPLLMEGVAAQRAEALGAWSVDGRAPDSWATPFIDEIGEAAGPARLDLLRSVDVSVMLPGAAAGQPVYTALQDVLGEGRSRTIHFHWAGAYNLDGTLRDPDPLIDAFYTRALEETDYEALAAAQRAFEEAVRGSTVRVTTPAGTDLSFGIGDRPVTRQDGDASAARMEGAVTLIDREVELPAGAVRVAPLETTVRGTIAFPPSFWAGALVEGLVLTFEDGVVVDIEADGDVGPVEAEMEEAGPAARRFREFALGFNPLLTIPEDGEPWIPYYGYGAGVVRLSLGDNSELGGDVRGGYVRWNFFTDATVEVGGEVWVEDGRLVR